jgi:hypothetical protein
MLTRLREVGVGNRRKPADGLNATITKTKSHFDGVRTTRCGQVYVSTANWVGGAEGVRREGSTLRVRLKIFNQGYVISDLAPFSISEFQRRFAPLKLAFPVRA